MFQFGRSKVFHKIYKDELIVAKNVTLYIQASANELITDGSGVSVNKVKLAHSGRKNIYLSAKVFILATGGWHRQSARCRGPVPPRPSAGAKWLSDSWRSATPQSRSALRFTICARWAARPSWVISSCPKQ